MHCPRTAMVTVLSDPYPRILVERSSKVESTGLRVNSGVLQMRVVSLTKIVEERILSNTHTKSGLKLIPVTVTESPVSSTCLGFTDKIWIGEYVGERVGTNVGREGDVEGKLV